jgi:hypothetical protein
MTRKRSLNFGQEMFPNGAKATRCAEDINAKVVTSLSDKRSTIHCFSCTSSSDHELRMMSANYHFSMRSICCPLGTLLRVYYKNMNIFCWPTNFVSFEYD